MAWDSAAVLTAVHALAAGAAQEAVLGIPESLGFQVTAYTFLLGGRFANPAFGIAEREGRVRTVFGYRVAGDEGTAETALAAAVDAFAVAFYADPSLGGAVQPGAYLDATAANAGEYELVLGETYRRLPLDVVYAQWSP